MYRKQCVCYMYNMLYNSEYNVFMYKNGLCASSHTLNNKLISNKLKYGVKCDDAAYTVEWMKYGKLQYNHQMCWSQAKIDWTQHLCSLELKKNAWIYATLYWHIFISQSFRVLYMKVQQKKLTHQLKHEILLKTQHFLTTHHTYKSFTNLYSFCFKSTEIILQSDCVRHIKTAFCVIIHGLCVNKNQIKNEVNVQKKNGKRKNNNNNQYA